MQFIKTPLTFNLQMLDVRDAEAFAERHMKGSTNIPLKFLKDRVLELPSKTEKCKFTVILNEKALEPCQAILNEIGYIDQVSNFVFWETIADSKEKEFENGHNCVPMFSASPLLESAIQAIENSLGRPGRALDLAAGCGRDSVFLARRGWSTFAVDYLPDQIARISSLAERYDVKDSVTPLQIDIEKEPISLDRLKGPYDLVNVARYLHRPLLPILPSLLNANGFICYHTFMKGCENSAVGRPRRPQFLLNPGELKGTFEKLGLAIIQDEVKEISDGRETSFFVAQKQGNNN